MKFMHASGSSPLDGYTIKRGVGQGGFGEVYYATSDAGKEVALKLIRRNLDVELRGVRQCLNLKHVNLVSVYDIKTDAADDRWVVMEYVSGESLEEAIERNPNGMPVDEALRWVHGIAAGVAYLHDHGIVHRDLKPGNIFTDEGIVKIGDYGLSKFISCSRRSGQTESVGTVHYMAPEIANGRYGREIDTYALGIILYEMLTGRVPFEGESVGEVLMKHLTAEPDLAALAEPYRTIVARALAKDPERRLRSAGELIAQLPPPPGGGFVVPPVTGSRAAEAAAPAGAAEVVAATVADVDEQKGEPIFQAVRRGWRNVRTEWTGTDMHPALKVTVAIGVILLLLINSGWLLPLAMVALVVYSVYWVVRAVLVTPKQTAAAPAPAAAPRPENLAGGSTPPPQPESTPRWGRRARRRRRQARHQPAASLRDKSPREKITELTGSMLLAALVVSIMGVVLTILSGGIEHEQFAWLAIVGTGAAWAILAVAKRWEGTAGDATLRRFAMLVVGLVVGAFASSVGAALHVGLPPDKNIVVGAVDISQRFYDVGGEPTLLAYLAYFGFIFLLVRWWRQADPLRAARLSLWSTGCCVFWAWALAQFWEFPQPWGLMLIAIISVGVQLASPWEGLRVQS